MFINIKLLENYFMIIKILQNIKLTKRKKINMNTSTRKISITWLSKIVIRTLKGNKLKIFSEI